jgi:hypothetical protein
MGMSTESVKKTKAPAKPRKVAAKKAVVAETPVAAVSHDEIAKLAERFWIERGWQDGYAEQDWLRAEQELSGAAS